MKKTRFAVLLLMLASGPAMLADIPAGWSTNYDDLISSPGTNEAPALLYFTASWCGPCKLMARTTLTAPAVTQVLSNVNHVALDIDEHPNLASKYGVEAVPTMILFSGAHEVDRTTGYQPVDEFLGWLTNGITEAGATVARLNRDRAALAEVDQLLVSQETNASRLAVPKLFDLCAERETDVATEAVRRLRGLATRDPLSILEGLKDSRLVVRIQAANVLHESLGSGFDVDPWCDDATRQKTVESWHVKLAKPGDPQP